MGLWYFLILFIGLFLVIKGLLGKKRLSSLLLDYYVFRSKYLCFLQEVMKSFRDYSI